MVDDLSNSIKKSQSDDELTPPSSNANESTPTSSDVDANESTSPSANADGTTPAPADAEESTSDADGTTPAPADAEESTSDANGTTPPPADAEESTSDAAEESTSDAAEESTHPVADDSPLSATDESPSDESTKPKSADTDETADSDDDKKINSSSKQKSLGTKLEEIIYESLPNDNEEHSVEDIQNIANTAEQDEILKEMKRIEKTSQEASSEAKKASLEAKDAVLDTQKSIEELKDLISQQKKVTVKPEETVESEETVEPEEPDEPEVTEVTEVPEVTGESEESSGFESNLLTSINNAFRKLRETHDDIKSVDKVQESDMIELNISLNGLNEQLKGACSKMNGKYDEDLNKCQLDITDSLLSIVKTIILKEPLDKKAEDSMVDFSLSAPSLAFADRDIQNSILKSRQEEESPRNIVLRRVMLVPKNDNYQHIQSPFQFMKGGGGHKKLSKNKKDNRILSPFQKGGNMICERENRSLIDAQGKCGKMNPLKQGGQVFQFPKKVETIYSSKIHRAEGTPMTGGKKSRRILKKRGGKCSAIRHVIDAQGKCGQINHENQGGQRFIFPKNVINKMSSDIHTANGTQS